MAEQSSRRDFLIGAGVVAATSVVASKMPLSAAQPTNGVRAPMLPQGGNFFECGHSGMTETIDEKAVLVYHQDTGEVLHTHIAITLKGGTIPTHEDLEKRVLNYADEVAEVQERHEKAQGKPHSFVKHDRGVMRILHAHPDQIRQGSFRVDVHRKEIVKMD